MYVPHTDEDRRAMLQRIGVDSIDELFRDVPAALPRASPDLPPALDEQQLGRLLRSLAGRNRPATALHSFLGAGAYPHHIPAVVGAILARGEYSTAYTPYQPEASQGTLIAIFEFQSMVAELFGLDVANASMYDGASSLAEGAIVAVRETRRSRVVVAESVHPAYRAVLASYLTPQNVALETAPVRDGRTDPADVERLCGDDTAAVVFQHPNVFGCLEPAEELCDIAHRRGALAVACGHPLAFGVLRPPGEFGADIACAEGQPLGLPLSFGGPYVGLLAARQRLMRKLPGRLVGQTTDAAGETGYVLTLQTREQHIRREKATSNICTNQALCALACTVYLSLLGPEGLREVSTLNIVRSDQLRRRIAASKAGRDGRAVPAHAGPWFNEFVLRLASDPDEVLSRMRANGVLGGVALRRWYPALDRHILVCCSEVHADEDLDAYVSALEAAL